MRLALILLGMALLALNGNLVFAQGGTVPGTTIPGSGTLGGNPLQAQQQLQQRMQQVQGQGNSALAEAMAIQRMLTRSRSNGPQVPAGINQGQQAQQAYLQQQQALAAAEAARKAERREKIKQSIIARKQKEEASKAAK